MNGFLENSPSNITLNWGDKWPVVGLITRDNYPAWNGEWPRYIPALKRCFYLSSSDMLPCNIASKT